MGTFAQFLVLRYNWSRYDESAFHLRKVVYDLHFVFGCGLIDGLDVAGPGFELQMIPKTASAIEQSRSRRWAGHLRFMMESTGNNVMV